MKQIIKRNLNLNINYTVIDKKYIPVSDGIGCACDNCGKLIANIATVKSANNEVFNIGFDCLETILINNSLLSDFDIQQYELIKKMIPKVLRCAKKIKEVQKLNNNIITGILFDTRVFGDFFKIYWLTNNQLISRNNDYFKIKDMDFNFLITTLRAIFPKLQIITNEN